MELLYLYISVGITEVGALSMASNLSVPESALFPVVKKIVQFDTNAAGQSSVPQRTAEHFELSFFISGSGTFFINGQAHEIKPGAVRQAYKGQKAPRRNVDKYYRYCSHVRLLV